MEGAAAVSSVLEVGPVAVRVLGRPPGEGRDRRTAAALGALDDRVALVDGRPVAVMQLWRSVLAGALGGWDGPLTVVHPSWWPPTRVRRVLAAAAAVAGPAVPVSRAEAFRREWPNPVVVVEVADEVVAVTGADGAVRVLGRDDLAAIAGAAASGRTVLLDAPEDVPDAAAAASALRKLLGASRVERVDLRSVMPPPARKVAPRRRLRPPATAVAAVFVVLAGAGVAVTWPRTGARPAAPVTLVEGRIAVDVPSDWSVRRVTDGPGSRRVEVVSPSDGAAVLHITGSYAPETSLAQAAGVLARAVAAAQPGVFVDFRGDGQVAGRPAVTYRERRPAREVLWTVVVDGAMRISIGCQSPAGGPAIRPVCEAAIRSARDAGAF